MYDKIALFIFSVNVFLQKIGLNARLFDFIKDKITYAWPYKFHACSLPP